MMLTGFMEEPLPTKTMVEDKFDANADANRADIYRHSANS